MKRYLCLRLPHLSIERLQKSDAERLGRQPSKSRAEAVVASTHGALKVVHCNLTARRGGVRIGHFLAEACALLPNLIIHQEDTTADRKALESLACWADCLSPVVQIEGEDSLLVDVTGCWRLFGGEEPLILQAIKGLSQQGYTSTAAISDTPGAAWALAHAGDQHYIIAPPGGITAAVAPLPVWALRIEPRINNMLQAVGVFTIESLLHLPRSSLAGRFGDKLLRRLDLVLGGISDTLTPFRPPPIVQAQVRFTGATDRLNLLQEAIDRALVVFCDQLSRKVTATREIHLTFYLEHRGHETIRLRVSRATRDHKRLKKLLFVKLDGIKLSRKVEALAIWTRQIEAHDNQQQQWLDTGCNDEAELGDLIDRLSVRLGPSGVVRATLEDDYQPEKAYQYRELTDIGLDNRQPSPHKTGPLRPLRLLQRPIEVVASSLAPDGPPIRFSFNGTDCSVVGCTGPERIETGWWRGRHIRRDYYCVESNNGCHYWLFRDRAAEQWYLHGLFE